MISPCEAVTCHVHAYASIQLILDELQIPMAGTNGGSFIWAERCMVSVFPETPPMTSWDYFTLLADEAASIMMMSNILYSSRTWTVSLK